MKKKIIVAGGGAAGMLAAISAAENGADVTLIEKNPVLGRKINATGNGRCNLTNAKAMDTCHYSGAEDSFISSVLSQFPVSEILSFFEGIGIETIEEENGKYFPICSQAAAVSELLERKVKSAGVKIILSSPIENIIPHKNTVTVRTASETFTADRIIIASGGLAAPETGSDGFGLDFAKKMGHTVKPLLPVIVQLKTKGGFYKRLEGLRVKAKVSLVIDGKIKGSVSGDLMFFEYGLSGPPIFTLSNKASEALANGSKVECIIDLLPQFSPSDGNSEPSVKNLNDNDLTDYILKRASAMDCTAEEFLVGLVHKKLIKQVLDNCSLNPEMRTFGFDTKDALSLMKALRYWKVSITGTKGFENAQATLGGVSANELDPVTLKSKKNGCVAFAGEVVDVVGECGGYNLTWAWASGYAAGKHIAE